MTGLFIKNEEGTSEIVTAGFYDCLFKISVLNKDSNTYLFDNIQATELFEPFIPLSTSTSTNHVLLEKTIELNNSTGFISGDRIKIGNNIYKISSINGNNVLINRGLLENVPLNSVVERVGNLGIYRLSLTFTELGQYTLIARDSVYGMMISNIIKVQEKSLETMYKDIKNLEYAILGN